VAEFLKGSFLDLQQAPLVAVSSKTGAGLEELKTALAKLAADISAKDSTAAFRLPIDRVFTMKGFGTVVTGTLISGTVRKDQEVELHPEGRRLRIRGVQVHGKTSEQAIAGQRTALNVAGVETSEMARGMMLTSPGMFRPTTQLSVRLDLLPSAKAVRDRARVHFHAFTAETIASVTLLGSKVMKPGESGFARLKLDRPLLLLPGDRFIVRQFSPVITIGGGEVLDVREPSRRIKSEERLTFLRKLVTAEPGEKLLARVTRRGAEGMSIAEAVAETGWLPEMIAGYAAQLTRTGKLLQLNDLMVAGDTLKALQTEMQSEVEAFHRANPLVAGIGREELRERLHLRAEVFDGVLQVLTREKKLACAGEAVHAAGRGVVLGDEEAQAKRQIEEAFAKAGLQVPALKDVLASLPLDKTRAQKIVTLLLRERVLTKLADDLVFHRDALDQLRGLIVGAKVKTPKLNVASFKELTGVSRKYAIPLLEYLDRERVTRRVGDERVIL
jgi:selenocysteine-specific elongation factor